MRAKASQDEVNNLIRLITEDGLNIKDAAARIGRSETWAYRTWRTARQTMPALTPASAAPVVSDSLTRPLAYHELTPPAASALEDYGLFRARYFGRRSSPWQEDAAHKLADLLTTPNKEYVVVNCPPGSGKSTQFVHDIPAWLTARNRAMRGFIGSSTQTMANSYTRRLRSTFERKIAMEAKSEEKRLGLAYDALSTMALDYGVFKPDLSIGAPWSASQFTVAQLGEISVDEKEATWTAFGRDTGFLGWRVNFIVWDDLVRRQDFIGDNKLDKILLDRAWWDDEAETRLEPGGLLILQGQRLGPEDLYKYCKDKLTYAEDIDFIDLGEEQQPQYKKYHTIIYKAHYEEHCDAHIQPEVHRRDALPYNPHDPDKGGCLLDPLRLPWRELKSIRDRPDSNYETVYQQGDVDPKTVLVPKYYIDGGTHEGEEYPGCYDDDRDINQMPTIKAPLSGTPLLKSVITADPSPTNFWAIQWWLYVQMPTDEHLMGTRYLLNQAFTRMGANDLLDYDVDTGQWEGLLVDWIGIAKATGLPIEYFILESNAAQKFMSQYKFFKKWFSNNSIRFKSHHTHINKLDPKLGVTTIKNHYRFGRVRLPGTVQGREVSKPLYDQVTNYPDYSYDDAVMAQWFFEYQLQHIVKRRKSIIKRALDIPSWMNVEPSYG